MLQLPPSPASAATGGRDVTNAKYYRRGFKTFAEYCKSKWGWEKAYCSMVIGASEVVRSLPPEKFTT